MNKKNADSRVISQTVLYVYSYLILIVYKPNALCWLSTWQDIELPREKNILSSVYVEFKGEEVPQA